LGVGRKPGQRLAWPRLTGASREP